MKSFKLKFAGIFTLLLLFSVTTVFGQQEDKKENKKEEKKIVIVKKIVDEDGNVTVERIVKEGADAEDVKVIELDGEDGNIIIEKIIGGDGGEGHDIHIMHMDGMSDEMKEKFHNIKVDVEEDNGERHIKIIMEKDGEGEPEIIEWRGEGEMPDDLKKYLDEKNIFIHEVHGEGDNDFIFHSKDMDNGNKACLGVKIGMTKEVENVNGEETVTIEGESDQGVAILDIIGDSGAEAAGLLKDDIITAINGTTVSSIEDVLAVLNPFEAGQTVAIDYLRNKQAAQVTATLKQCASPKASEKMIWIDDEGNDFEFDNDSDWEFQDENGKVMKKSKRIIIIKESDENGEETTEEFTFEPVEVGENSLDLQEIDLYPNPTDGNLNVSFRADAVPTTVRIVDITGKEVYNNEILDFDGSFQKEISLGAAAKGALLLTIQQGDKVFTEKIVLH